MLAPLIKKLLSSYGLNPEQVKTVSDVLLKHDLSKLTPGNMEEFMSTIFKELNFTLEQQQEAQKMIQSMLKAKK